MSANRAADQIVAATRTGRSEKVLSTQANLLARLNGLFPEAVAEMLGVVNRLLPDGHAAGQSKGRALARPLVYALTSFGRRAAKEFGQPALHPLQ